MGRQKWTLSPPKSTKLLEKGTRLKGKKREGVPVIFPHCGPILSQKEGSSDKNQKKPKGGSKNVTFSRFFRFFWGSTSQYPRGEYMELYFLFKRLLVTLSF